MLRNNKKQQKKASDKPQRTGLLFWVRDGITDEIELLESNYDNVRSDYQSLLFSAPGVPYDTETIISNISSSPLLNNGGELIGDTVNNKYAIYMENTNFVILRRAYNYAGLDYPNDSFTYTFPFFLE